MGCSRTAPELAQDDYQSRPAPFLILGASSDTLHNKTLTYWESSNDDACAEARQIPTSFSGESVLGSARKRDREDFWHS